MTDQNFNAFRAMNLCSFCLQENVVSRRRVDSIRITKHLVSQCCTLRMGLFLFCKTWSIRRFIVCILFNAVVIDQWRRQESQHILTRCYVRSHFIDACSYACCNIAIAIVLDLCSFLSLLAKSVFYSIVSRPRILHWNFNNSLKYFSFSFLFLCVFCYSLLFNYR